MSNDKVIYEHHWPGTGYYYIGIGGKYRASNLRNRSDFHKSITKKHGAPVVTIMAEGLSWEEACSREIATIGFYRAAGIDLVNHTDGGEGTIGYRHTDETKAAISKIVSEAMKSPEVRQKLVNAWSAPEVKAKVSGVNNHNYGKQLSRETREKISAANKGLLVGDKNPMRRPEIKAKLRGELNGFFGKTHTKETREKISAATKGVLVGDKNPMRRPEVAAKFKGANHPLYGKNHSEESKAKMSASKKGKKIGGKHHNYDATVRHFVNDNGAEFVGTQYELSISYGLNRGHVSAVVRRELKQHRGWRYIGEYKEAA